MKFYCVSRTEDKGTKRHFLHKEATVFIFKVFNYSKRQTHAITNSQEHMTDIWGDSQVQAEVLAALQSWRSDGGLTAIHPPSFWILQ
jgi:hypothetical protein